MAFRSLRARLTLSTSPAGCRGDCPCAGALAQAIITERDAGTAEIKRDLAPLIGKYVGG